MTSKVLPNILCRRLLGIQVGMDHRDQKYKRQGLKVKSHICSSMVHIAPTRKIDTTPLTIEKRPTGTSEMTHRHSGHEARLLAH